MLEPTQDLGQLNFGSAMSACKGKSLGFECTSLTQIKDGTRLVSAMKQPRILSEETIETDFKKSSVLLDTD